MVRLSPAPLAIESLVHFEHTGPNANVTTTRCFCAVGTQSTNGDGDGSSLVHAFVGSSSSMFTFELRGPSFAGGSVEGAPRDNAEEGRVANNHREAKEVTAEKGGEFTGVRIINFASPPSTAVSLGREI